MQVRMELPPRYAAAVYLDVLERRAFDEIDILRTWYTNDILQMV